MEFPEQIYLGESMDKPGVAYVRGDIVEAIRQQKRDAEARVGRLQGIVGKFRDSISTEVTLQQGASVIDPTAPGHNTWNADYSFEIHLTVKEIREFMGVTKAAELGEANA